MTAISIGDPTRLAATGRPVVLLVESDQRLATHLERALTAAGYQVQLATDGSHALSVLELLGPDVVLLNRELAGSGGLELARRLRAASDVPIIMLSELSDLDARIAGLDAGADDYLAKPFAVEELLARLRAIRRGRALAAAATRSRAQKGILTYADVQLDQDTREVTRGARRLELRNKAFELLAFFMRHPERVLSRRELLEQVWGYEFLGDSNVIEVTMSHVRQALEANGESRLIHTVRPIGYILNDREST